MQFLVNKATCLGNPDNHDENDDKKKLQSNVAESSCWGVMIANTNGSPTKWCWVLFIQQI